MGFIPRLESLRGIAALTVVAAHVWGQFSDAPSAGWDAAVFQGLKGLSNGTGAVVGFFVISGFVLARSLEANADPSRYFRHRIFRLFPAAITVVALFTALHQWFGIYVANEGDFRPGNVILNMLMIRTDINAVMWSMKVECVATPVILFSVWLVQRDGASWLWAIIAVLFALSFWGPYVHALGDASNLASFYAFLVGVLAQHYGKRIAGIRPSVATIAALLSVVVFCYLGPKADRARSDARMPLRRLPGCLDRVATGRAVSTPRSRRCQVLRKDLLQLLFAAPSRHSVREPDSGRGALSARRLAGLFRHDHGPDCFRSDDHAGGLPILALYRGAVHQSGEEFQGIPARSRVTSAVVLPIRPLGPNRFACRFLLQQAQPG
jgi:Acyltransferase family